MLIRGVGVVEVVFALLVEKARSRNGPNGTVSQGKRKHRNVDKFGGFPLPRVPLFLGLPFFIRQDNFSLQNHPKRKGLATSNL